jgi:hypothetical protein
VEKMKGRSAILLIVLSLLFIQSHIYNDVLASSLPSIRLLTLSISGKSISYENLAPDSLVEVEVQPAKEVQAMLILEVEKDKIISVWTGLSNTLFSWEGSEVINKSSSYVIVKSLEQKLVIKVYGTYDQAYKSTILFVSLDDLTPLLIVRSKILEEYSERKEGSEVEKKVSELKEVLLRAQLPTSRREYYNNIILHAQIAEMKGNVIEALEVVGNALDELRSEHLKSKEAMILIENANTTLMINKAKLPLQRAVNTESQLRLAILKWETGDYEEAKRLANEAKNLATWTTWDEMADWIIRFIPFIIGGIIIIPLALVLLRFRKTKQRAGKPALTKEIYGE